MSVLLETSAGDIVVDLLVNKAPKCCENFLKLCKIKYYNFSPISTVQKGFSFQTGDPIGPDSKDSDGGTSIWGILEGPSKKFFTPEIDEKLKHLERGTVSMATTKMSARSEDRKCGSQFLITLGDNLDYLDAKAAIFGNVVEGFDALERINTAYCDSRNRPLKDIRILHTIILDDPYDDSPSLRVPEKSPVPTRAQLANVRLAYDAEIKEEEDAEEAERQRREKEARAQALTLEVVGDLPFAEVKPPENVLFVCKLNPVTQDEDLELIFSRFGKILSCEVIRDKRTGDSLQYAFIEFDEQASCEQAYFKMQDVLIDDHRIHVDFSQSVSKLSDTWRTATVDRRRRDGGKGFGGSEALEKRTQYKNQAYQHREDTRYKAILNPGPIREESGVRRRSRSRSSTRSRSPPRRRHSRERDYRRGEPRQYRESYRDRGDKHRSGAHSRKRDRRYR